MKRKTVIKILIDLAMLVIYLQLMFCYDLNTLYHEVMGIAIGALFIAHVALNAKSIIGLLRKLPQGKLSPLKTVLVIADCLLPLGMIAIIASGILIARDLFIGPGSLEVVTIHNIASYICLTILVLHTALHARYLVGIIKKIARSDIPQRIASATAAVFVTSILVWTDLLGGMTESTLTAQATTTEATSLVSQAQDLSDVTAESARKQERNDESIGNESTDESASPSSDGATVSPSDQSSATTGQGTTSIVCTLCPKACPLTNLRCSRGTQWAQENGYV
ncbi:MAG: DUF4405 domain-containing protein [Gordonibacter sp.]|nr:DUF4405 domain-containing protein [Gordonibacter sp.]